MEQAIKSLRGVSLFNPAGVEFKNSKVINLYVQHVICTLEIARLIKVNSL